MTVIGPIELLLTFYSIDLLLEVIYGCPAPIDDALIESLGHTVTVFGATGFLGRYIVNRLGTPAWNSV